jgi:hypothetical protein
MVEETKAEEEGQMIFGKGERKDFDFQFIFVNVLNPHKIDLAKQ